MFNNKVQKTDPTPNEGVFTAPRRAAEAVLAAHGYRVAGDSTVSFTILPGESVKSVLQTVQALGARLYDRSPVWPSRLQHWSELPEFQRAATEIESHCISVNVPGSNHKTRREVEQFLDAKGLDMAELVYVTAAHALHFLATGEDLFDGMIQRVKGGKLYYGDGGLSFMEESDYIDSCRYKHVTTAAQR